MTKPKKARGSALKLAASALALTIGAGISSRAAAQDAPDGAWNEQNVIVNDTMNPNTSTSVGGALDDTVSLNGVGMINVAASPTVNSRFICSGTLINPRTVIFAAHCVNFQPMESYGPNGVAFGPWTGGTPIAVGFEFDNLAGVRQWFGLASVPGGTDANPALRFNTNAARNFYEVEQVWYDQRSLAPSSIGFLEADIAIATLDTHVGDIPTWVLLFTPLTGETHGVVTGYGVNGTNTTAQGPGCTTACSPLGGIDNRRRAAENMISFLGSLDDRNDWLFGPGVAAPNPQTLYQLDFDSHTGQGTGFDFDLFDGAALPREGITAGGDSGGPLIADEYFADGPDVVVATLSGGTRFFNGQRFSTYGTNSFYQPLFMFWQEIVANNPYAYAGNLPGNRDWMNPAHWVQLMDPAYGIEIDGELVNALPGTPSYGVNGETPKWGTVCFLDDCTDNALDSEATPYVLGTPNSIYVPGGPGTTNFVPNNVVANPAAGIKARYYDVTLSSIGMTWLDTSVTIDRFTLDGALTGLDVRAGGTLNVWGDFTVGSGFLTIDGRVNSGEGLLIQGLLSGRGTFNPTYLTSVDGMIAPGGVTATNTLTVQADVVLASNSDLLIELGNNVNDQLRVTADPAQGTTGIISLGGDLWLSPAANGGNPRHGRTYTIVSADGGVLNTFDDVNAFLGVLQPTVTYNANTVTVKLEAGSFLRLITNNAALMPLALALDELREDHYLSLYNLYGEIDVMDPNRLSAAFSSLMPGSLTDVNGLMAMQGSAFGDTLYDRLSLLSREGGAPAGLSIMGSPGEVFALGGDEGFGGATALSLTSMLSRTQTIALRSGMTAFISGGYSEDRASTEAGRSASTLDDGLRSWNMFGGVEHTMGDLTLGVAGGYSHGNAYQSGAGALAENDLAQTALYGVYRLDRGMYVSGLVGYGSSHANTERDFVAGLLAYEMQGETSGQLLLASIEGGVNIELGSNFVLTPNVALRHQGMSVSGLTESGDETALRIAEQNYERLEARAGVRFAGDRTFRSGWTLAPSLDLAAVANLADHDGGILASFAVAPDVSFYLPGMQHDDFWGEVVGGLSLARDNTSFSVRMETSVARDDLYDDRAMARFQYNF